MISNQKKSNIILRKHFRKPTRTSICHFKKIQNFRLFDFSKTKKHHEMVRSTLLQLAVRRALRAFFGGPLVKRFFF